MPRDLIMRVDWGLMYPAFYEKVFELLSRCRTQGHDYYVICGYRSPEQQQIEFNKGRVTPGPRVTRARPWQSAHQYGIAIDVALDKDAQKPGLQPDWSKLELYRPFADEAKKLGLDAAYFWKDNQEGPHVQLDIASRGITYAFLKDAYDKGGKNLQAVFNYLDARGPW